MLAKVPMSISEIVSDVKQPASLVRLERELAAARAEREAIQAQIHALIKANDFCARDKELAALVNEQSKAEAKVKAAHAAVRPERDSYGAAVARALAPLRGEAAGRILALLSEIRDAARTLEQSMIEIEMRGGRCIRVPPLPEILAGAEIAAHTIAGEK